MKKKAFLALSRKLLMLQFFIFLLFSSVKAQTTYTWTNSTGDKEWQTAANWAPVRTTPATTDILVFNSGGNQFLRFSPAAQTIGQLLISNNTTLDISVPTLLSSTGGLHTITISGLAGDDFTINPGSKVYFTTNNRTGDKVQLYIATGATAKISGSIFFGESPYTMDAADAGAISFEANSSCQLLTSNPVFTTSGTPNAVIFKNNSTLTIGQSGDIPFGLTAPASKIILEPNSMILASERAGLTENTFNGRTVGNLTLANSGTFGATTFTGNLPFTVNSLDVGYSGTKTFNITGGITITGNINVSSGINFFPPSASEVKLQGTVNQAINLNTAYGNGTINIGANTTLKINNAAGATVSGSNANCFSTPCKSIIVNGAVNFTSGVIKLTDGAGFIVGATGSVQNVSAVSFVDGKVKKEGASSFVFPVGKTNVGYVPIAIPFTTIVSDISAEYIHNNAQLLSTSYPAGLHHVSPTGYWIVETSLPVGSNWFSNISGYWNAQISNNGSAGYINNPASLRLAHYDTTLKLWDRFGGAADGWSTNTAGAVTWGSQPYFTGVWALASIDNSNPLASVGGGTLPIKVQYFNGNKQGGSNVINWQAACTNTSAVKFSLLRGTSRANMQEISIINASALTCQQPFGYTDNTPAQGLNYYQLKITEANGKVNYSSVIVLINYTDGFEVMGINPTLVTSAAVVNISAARKTKAIIMLQGTDGTVLQQHNVTLPAGSTQFTINGIGLPTGMYFVKVIPDAGEAKVLRFIKQ